MFILILWKDIGCIPVIFPDNIKKVLNTILLPEGFPVILNDGRQILDVAYVGAIVNKDVLGQTCFF